MSLKKSQIKSLGRILPQDCLLLTPPEKLIYGTDAGRRFAMPWAVVLPKTVQQVRMVMHWALQERVPVIPRARGTNVVSACVPHTGGIVLSCLRLNRIVSISNRDFTACVQPGVITYELQEAARVRGLFYPPDPASVRVCSIGGNIATNAGGMRAVKYGVTRDYVLGLEVVLPGGELLMTGARVHKNVVGLDLTSLMVGSEGCLGVVVGAWIKLLPLPQYAATMLACFENEEHALESVDNIFGAGLLPAALEFLPREVLECLSGYADMPWPHNAGAALVIQCDGLEGSVKQEMAALRQSLANPVYSDEAEHKEQERIWELRRLINPASFRLGTGKASDDVSVPRGSLLQAIRGIRRIAGDNSLQVLVFGHVGDGNLHVNFMYDDSLQGIELHIRSAREELMDLVLGLGGSISGEHGVGLSKKPFSGRQPGALALEYMRGIKRVFDPENILNPGKL
ncbi:FAD-linked oxidase C-terminal domain-containing protein [Desulfonatronospira sp.]|uniref:FAD-binding oxidoreductase n=1 Tax=Desulfonatronospira sp. TaxID=1962951 RepID=UPI0025C26620|nr:FAD-linked oxidase C-terminal domain-containing protein [Desulfonatronospira sp.]